MTKQQKYALFLSICFFMAAIGFDFYLNNTSKLHIYTDQIEKELHQQEVGVRRFFENKEFIQRQLDRATISTPEELQNDYDYISQLSQEHFTVLIYKDDKLIFWNNQYSSPPDSALHKTREESAGMSTSFVETTNGYYLMKSQHFISKNAGAYRLIAMIPIKYNFSIESNYLSNRFVAHANIPMEIAVSERYSEYPISDKMGNTVFYLNSDGAIFDKVQQRRLLYLYLIGFFLLLSYFNATAKKMISEGAPLLGAGLFIFAVFAIRLLTILFHFSERFSQLPAFAQTFQKSLISTSLGDLLINIVLLLWIMFFFHKEFPNRSFAHHVPNVKFGLTYISYLFVISGVLVLSWVFKSLIFNNNIQFDFYNTLDQSHAGMMAVVGIILLLIALFLFSHKMMLNIATINLPGKERLMAIFLAILTLAPIIYFMNFMLPVVYLLLLAAIFVFLFDMFIDSKSGTFTWLVIWLVVLSAFPSTLLFKYNSYQDRILRSNYAENLADLNDKNAEPALSDLIKKISADSTFKELFLPHGFLENNNIRRTLEQYFYDNNYLFYNYAFALNAYDENGAVIYQEVEENLPSFQSAFQKALPTDHRGLKLSIDPELYRINYLMNFELANTESYNKPIQLTLRVNRKRREQSKVYTELLVDRPYKNLSDLDKYDYAIYKNKIKIDGERGDYSNIYNLSRTPEAGQTISIEIDGRSEIVHASNEGIIVVIGKELEEYTAIISFFSYIFGAMVLFILLVAAINKMIHFLPGTLHFSLFQRVASLKNRIQLFFLSLVLGSFIIIGFVTIWFFQDSNHNYHENRLKRKADSILKDTEHELKMMYDLGDSLDLSKLIEPISKIHSIDINMYNLDGYLMASSEKDIFRQGVIERRLSAPALYALGRQKQSEVRHENEHIGDLYYNAAYLALNDPNGKTVAYIGLPYYSKQRALRSDVSFFMSTLLNVYVFLLLIAGAIAILVADNITSPLVQIGEKMKQVKLGKRNEPLEYPSKDEIGTLVAEFNKMTRELENNALQLEQTAQEGAWREMAKQVAHEIKNPLTPMKLSIQYLLHAYQSNPDDIEPLMKRVANTLIEQIDNLSSIAQEFSNFAKMPRAENERTLLNTLVGSVFELFSNESSDRMELKLQQPPEQFYVFADRKHLMRVLNNLIKNAIQAIPDDRKGLVVVSLYKKYDTAIIKVADNGCGISDDKKDKVFVPNFTTKNSGTGLGLAISKNIIESVNGRIWFDTTPNVGTDFYVELPLVEINELEEVG